MQNFVETPKLSQIFLKLGQSKKFQMISIRERSRIMSACLGGGGGGSDQKC